MKWRRTLLSVLLVILIAGSLAAYLLVSRNSPAKPVCGPGQDFSISSESGFTYVCGTGSASDGRLSITLHNYHFDEAGRINFEPGSNQVNPPSSSLFLLANVTISNVGSGNTSLGGGFSVQVTNGTGSFQNQNYIENASFPGTYPNKTIPDINGGLYLPAGSNVDLWIMFYIPNPGSEAANLLVLQYFSYRELFYGGNYEGNGAFGCPNPPSCYLSVDFVVTPV